MMRQRFVARLRCFGAAASPGRLRRERGRPSAWHRDSPGTGSHHVQPARGADPVRQLHHVPSPGRGRALSVDELSRCSAAGQGHRRGHGGSRHAALEGRAGDVEFANARRLTDQQIDIIQRWVADGALEGDATLLPPLPQFTEGWQLGPPDLAVTMSEAFEVPASGPDVYRSFVVPLNLDRDVWVRAIDFRPSARAVVHHSLFFLDATGAARERDESDPGPGFAGSMGGGVRLGGRGGGGGSPVCSAAAAAPTIRPPIRSRAWREVSAAGRSAVARSNCPTGLAFPLPKGSDLILSTHFHPSGKAQMEKSTVGLYFASGPPTQAFTTIQLPPLFSVFEGLDIPAGQERYTVQDSFVIPIDVKAFSVGAHAHYLGKEMKLTATLPDGTAKTLLWIKDWDFSWQERYRFADSSRCRRAPGSTRRSATTTRRRTSGIPAVRRCA